MKIARDVMSKKPVVGTTTEGTAVVVLKSDLPAGAALTSADLDTVLVSGKVNTEAVFTSPAALEGRVLIADTTRGTPISSALLAPAGSGTGLQALIPEGMRAITVEINEFSGVAGFLGQGCRVDVVATLNDPSGGMISRTIVQNVKVQAIGSRQQADASAPVRSVTLLTTPKEAEAIELACATGRPRLVLRPSTDNATENTPGVTIAELRGSPRDADPFGASPVALLTPAPTSQPVQTVPVMRIESKPAPRSTWQRKVQVIRGGQEGVVTFDEVATPNNPRWITGANTDEIPSDSEQ
jgi:pilus assembly protein CpaB